MHIFISYSRKDSAFANRIYTLLTKANFPCFIDTRNKTTGSDLSDEDKQKISDSFAVVVIMTDNSPTPDWVRDEINFARKRLIPIVPISLSGAVWSDMKVHKPVTMDAASALPDRLVRVLERNQTQRNLLTSKKLWGGIAIGVSVVLIAVLGWLFWPDNKSNNGDGTPISQVASATDTVDAPDTPTPTITLTPSHTPNANEIVQTAAAATLTTTAIVVAVDQRVVELQTQQAATNAYFATGTALAQPTPTETPTTTPTVLATDDSNIQGVDTPRPTITPTASPTASESATASPTPDWVATAGTQISMETTATALAIVPTSTRAPSRVPRTPTPTVSPSATPSQRQPENQPIVPTTPIPSLTPSSTLSATPTDTATLMPPSLTASSTTSPTATATLSPTAPTMPPATALFDSGTPGIANNPSHVLIAVYAGPSYESAIVSFLYHTQAISIMGEVPGWVFIGYGWVRFDRVFPIGDESVIPIFQTQVFAHTPAAFSNEDIRALGYHGMTQTAAYRTFTPTPTDEGGVGGQGATATYAGPTLDYRIYQTFVAGETLTAVPTSTPTPTTPAPTLTLTHTPTRTFTPSRTPSDTARPPATHTPSRTPTRTVTPLPPSNTPLPTATNTPLPTNTPIPPPTNTPRPPTPIPQPTATIPFAISITSVMPGAYGSKDGGVGCYANITVSVTEDISGEIWVTNANWNQGPESYYQFFAAGTNPYTATLGGDDLARDHTITIITPKGQTSISGVRCG